MNIIPNGQVYFAPVGTLVSDAAWEPLGYSEDGYIHDDGLPLSANPVRTMSPVRREFTLTMANRNSRAVMKLLWGTYRMPGDKPLIHNGRKPR